MSSLALLFAWLAAMIGAWSVFCFLRDALFRLRLLRARQRRRSKQERRAFNQKWPPLGDREFVARCDAGVDRAVALKVRAIVADRLGVNYQQVYPEQSLVDDLGAE